ncbi:hypothetical protein IFM89_009950 [Coptis chinensis]|uniref:RNase H type-1 domain-containing protein n=1 Tax=Coptis chinensis TaxID=261450 RepID=A0A835HK94_9MAGN|nr:hypothetical protein IFM89_009950 [Coptis chinensis]
MSRRQKKRWRQKNKEVVITGGNVALTSDGSGSSENSAGPVQVPTTVVLPTSMDDGVPGIPEDPPGLASKEPLVPSEANHPLQDKVASHEQPSEQAPMGSEMVVFEDLQTNNVVGTHSELLSNSNPFEVLSNENEEQCQVAAEASVMAQRWVDQVEDSAIITVPDVPKKNQKKESGSYHKRSSVWGGIKEALTEILPRSQWVVDAYKLAKMWSLRLKHLWTAALIGSMIEIWKHRNRINFEGKKANLDECKLLIQYDIFTTAHLSKASNNSSFRDVATLRAWNLTNRPRAAPTTKQCTWVPPERDFMKLNTDGAAFGNPGPSGIDVTFRDFEGSFKLSLCPNIGN